MSTWTDMRDKALAEMKEDISDVTEETKQKFMDEAINAGIPVVEGYAEAFTAEVEKQSTNESGWCKIRDMLVIPALVKTLVWMTKRIVTHVAEKAAKEKAATA